jgi:tryptophan-rich sensory protein
MPLPDKSLPFREWYDLLTKPSWTPSVSTIGTIWTVLYPLIAGVYGYALIKVVRGEWPRLLLLPIILNIVCNLGFTPVQFGLRNFTLASFVVVATCLTALWSAVALYPHNRALAYLLIPYIAWTAVASVLQIEITWMNW